MLAFIKNWNWTFIFGHNVCSLTTIFSIKSHRISIYTTSQEQCLGNVLNFRYSSYRVEVCYEHVSCFNLGLLLCYKPEHWAINCAYKFHTGGKREIKFWYDRKDFKQIFSYWDEITATKIADIHHQILIVFFALLDVKEILS